MQKQEDSREQLTGPAAKIAFRDGLPTPAATAFAKKAGVDVSALALLTTPKGQYVSATATRVGRSATAILAEQIPELLSQLHWGKSMYWREAKPEKFVRPLQWLLALLDEEIVPLRFAGIEAGRETYGHRILCGERPITIAHPHEYEARLESAYVLASSAVRRHRIRKGLDAVTTGSAMARR